MERNVIVDDLEAVHTDNEIRCFIKVAGKIWTAESKEGSIAVRSRDGPVERFLAAHDKEFVWSMMKRGSHVWVGYSSGYIRVVHMDNQRILHEMLEHAGGIYHLAACGDHVFSASNDNEIFQWNVDTFGLVQVYSGHTEAVRCLVSFSAATLFSGSDDSTIRCWDAEERLCKHQLRGHKSAVLAMVLSYGDALWSASQDTTLKVWDTKKYKCIQTLTEHRGPITALANVGDFVLSGSVDHSICMWDSRSYQCIHSLHSHTGFINCIGYVSAAVKYTFWSTSSDKTIRRWTFEISGGSIDREAITKLGVEPLMDDGKEGKSKNSKGEAHWKQLLKDVEAKHVESTKALKADNEHLKQQQQFFDTKLRETATLFDHIQSQTASIKKDYELEIEDLKAQLIMAKRSNHTQHQDIQKLQQLLSQTKKSSSSKNSFDEATVQANPKQLDRDAEFILKTREDFVHNTVVSKNLVEQGYKKLRDCLRSTMLKSCGVPTREALTNQLTEVEHCMYNIMLAHQHSVQTFFTDDEKSQHPQAQLPSSRPPSETGTGNKPNKVTSIDGLVSDGHSPSGHHVVGGRFSSSSTTGSHKSPKYDKYSSKGSQYSDTGPLHVYDDITPTKNEITKRVAGGNQHHNRGEAVAPSGGGGVSSPTRYPSPSPHYIRSMSASKRSNSATDQHGHLSAPTSPHGGSATPRDRSVSPTRCHMALLAAQSQGVDPRDLANGAPHAYFYGSYHLNPVPNPLNPNKSDTKSQSGSVLSNKSSQSGVKGLDAFKSAPDTSPSVAKSVATQSTATTGVKGEKELHVRNNTSSKHNPKDLLTPDVVGGLVIGTPIDDATSKSSSRPSRQQRKPPLDTGLVGTRASSRDTARSKSPQNRVTGTGAFGLSSSLKKRMGRTPPGSIASSRGPPSVGGESRGSGTDRDVLFPVRPEAANFLRRGQGPKIKTPNSKGAAGAARPKRTHSASSGPKGYSDVESMGGQSNHSRSVSATPLGRRGWGGGSEVSSRHNSKSSNCGHESEGDNVGMVSRNSGANRPEGVGTRGTGGSGGDPTPKLVPNGNNDKKTDNKQKKPATGGSTGGGAPRKSSTDYTSLFGGSDKQYDATPTPRSQNSLPIPVSPPTPSSSASAGATPGGIGSPTSPKVQSLNVNDGTAKAAELKNKDKDNNTNGSTNTSTTNPRGLPTSSPLTRTLPLPQSPTSDTTTVKAPSVQSKTPKGNDSDKSNSDNEETNLSDDDQSSNSSASGSLSHSDGSPGGKGGNTFQEQHEEGSVGKSQEAQTPPPHNKQQGDALKDSTANTPAPSTPTTTPTLRPQPDPQKSQQGNSTTTKGAQPTTTKQADESKPEIKAPRKHIAVAGTAAKPTDKSSGQPKTGPQSKVANEGVNAKTPIGGSAVGAVVGDKQPSTNNKVLPKGAATHATATNGTKGGSSGTPTTTGGSGNSHTSQTNTQPHIPTTTATSTKTNAKPTVPEKSGNSSPAAASGSPSSRSRHSQLSDDDTASTTNTSTNTSNSSESESTSSNDSSSDDSEKRHAANAKAKAASLLEFIKAKARQDAQEANAVDSEKRKAASQARIDRLKGSHIALLAQLDALTNGGSNGHNDTSSDEDAPKRKTKARRGKHDSDEDLEVSSLTDSSQD